MSLTDTLDGFFLTKPLATSDLKERVEEVKGKLTELQFAYTDAQGDFTRVQADLLKMEEKSDYLMAELDKAMTVFDVPPDGDPAKAYEFMQKYIHSPAEWVSLYAGAAGGGALVLAAAGPRLAKLMSKAKGFRKLSGVAKSPKWLKLAKVGKATVVFSVVVFAADFAVQCMAADAINDDLRRQWEELEKQAKEAAAELAKLEEAVEEATTARDEILAESGSSDIAEFVKNMNAAITELGRQTGYLRTARRMLLAGQAAVNVEMFVPDLPPESIATLARKLELESGLLAGKNGDILAEATGFKPTEVDLVATLWSARGEVIAGRTADEIVESLTLEPAIVEGVEETLEDDRRHARMLLSRDTPHEAIRAQTLLPIAEIERMAA